MENRLKFFFRVNATPGTQGAGKRTPTAALYCVLPVIQYQPHPKQKACVAALCAFSRTLDDSRLSPGLCGGKQAKEKPPGRIRAALALLIPLQ